MHRPGKRLMRGSFFFPEKVSLLNLCAGRGMRAHHSEKPAFIQGGIHAKMEIACKMERCYNLGRDCTNYKEQKTA